MLARQIEKRLFFIADILSFNLSFASIFWLRYKSGWVQSTFNPHKDFSEFSAAAFILSLLWISYFYLTGMYRDWYLQSRTFQILVGTKKIFHGVLILFFVTVGSDLMEMARSGNFFGLISWTRLLSFLCYFAIFVVSVNGFRLLVQSAVHRLLRKGIGQNRILILGANDTGKRIQAELLKNPTMGWKPWGFVDESLGGKSEKFNELYVFGKYSDLPRLVEQEKVGGIVISHDSASHNEIVRILSHIAEYPLTIFIVPDLYDAVSGHFKTSAVNGMTLKQLFPEHMQPWEAQIKRFMDIAFSSLFLILASPLLLAVALAIRLDSAGPAFYSQERIGQYGKRFRVYKFRTMRTDAEKAGPQWAKDKDPRITRLGRFLRKTRIDEIPQLWCVLRGEMSLVGPRPEREHFISQLKHEVPLYMRRLKMKPGLTGWAQVKHKYDESIEDVKTKVMFDLYYFENMSLALDVLILIRTVWVVLSGHGAK